MRSLWKSFKRKFLTDRADSILVPAMILAPVMVITLGISVEVVKNNFIRTERINAIQDSASSAVTLTDTRGSLDWRVVNRIVNEYELNRFGKTVFSNADESGRVLYQDRDSSGKLITDSADGRALGDVSVGEEGCLVGHGDNDGELYPQYRITLDTGRGENLDPAGNSRSHPETVSFTRSQPDIDSLNNMAPLTGPTKVDENGKPLIYRSVTVEIIDQTPNMIMSMLGSPCQKFDLTASAVTFSASSDLQ